MLLDLLQERMLIFEILIQRLDLSLHMRQFPSRVIEAPFMVSSSLRHEFAAGIFQRLLPPRRHSD